ncbi:hypothetical protein HW132_16230 [Brasilonema sp. CT11]|nr:hypothetical protein [Brasilonema sp. CT11]
MANATPYGYRERPSPRSGDPPKSAGLTSHPLSGYPPKQYWTYPTGSQMTNHSSLITRNLSYLASRYVTLAGRCLTLLSASLNHNFIPMIRKIPLYE